MGPTTIDRNSRPALTVKEDCVLEDSTGTLNSTTQLKTNTSYYLKNLTLRCYQGSKFLSTNCHTKFSEEAQTLSTLIGPEVLNTPEKEIVVSHVKLTYLKRAKSVKNMLLSDNCHN